MSLVSMDISFLKRDLPYPAVTVKFRKEVKDNSSGGVIYMLDKPIALKGYNSVIVTNYLIKTTHQIQNP